MKLNTFYIASGCLLLAGCGRSSQEYLDRGNSFFAEGKYADAQINFTKAIQKNAQFGEAYYRLGLTFTKQNKAAEAYTTLRKAVELLPDRIDAKVSLADLCFSLYLLDNRLKPMYDEVVSLASTIVKQKPDSSEGYRFKGALSLVDGKPGEAVELYRKANELRQQNGDIVLGYMQALSGSGRSAESESLAQAFLEKNKTFIPLYDTLYKQYMAAARVPDAEQVLKQWRDNNPRNATAVLRLAEHYFRLQKTTEMNAALKRMVDDRASFPEGRLQAGNFYASLGNWPEAVVNYERGAQEDQKNALVYRKRIVAALLAQGKPQDALDILGAILKQDSKDTEVRIARARLWVEMGKPDGLDRATTEIQALLKERPQDTILLFDLGRAYARKGDPDAARRFFLEAAQLRKDFFPARYELGQLALNQQNSADALRFAEEILAVNPQDPKARLLRAGALLQAGRLPEGRAELRRMASEYPQSTEVNLQLGLLAIYEKRFKDAEDTFRKFGGAEKDVRFVLGLAAAYTSQKQFDRAIQLLTDESKKAPSNTAVFNLLAVTAVQAGRYPLAIETFQRVLAANPNSLDARINLAEAHRVGGDLNAALGELEKAKQLDPQNPPAVTSLAAAFYKAGRLAESRDLLRRLVQLQPGNASALNSLAFLITETGGDLNEAQRFAQDAVQKNGNDPHNQDTLGWIYLKKNMTDTAMQIFSSLIKKEPGNPTYRYHLGAALLKKGDKEKARTELHAALARKPEPAEEKSIRELVGSLN